MEKFILSVVAVAMIALCVAEVPRAVDRELSYREAVVNSSR
jgi:hypothetical protein